MNPNIQTHFQRLQTQTQILLKDVQQLTEIQYNRSVDGKWSAAQIMTHLLSAEKLSLGYMKKKSLGIANLKDSGWLESVKTLVLIISQRLPFRYKAPPVVVNHTPAPVPFDLLETAWKVHHEELASFLEKFDQSQMKRKVFKHPVAGMLNVMQALIFFREHIRHHLPQVKRLSK